MGTREGDVSGVFDLFTPIQQSYLGPTCHAAQRDALAPRGRETSSLPVQECDSRLVHPDGLKETCWSPL